MINNRCTLLVASCDAYEDTWEPFFHMLEIMWPDMPFQVVLNTESKSFTYPGFTINTFNLMPKGKDKWGKRLKETLKRIDTEYVMFVLDDYFPLKPVNQKMIDECLDVMDKNPEISSLGFKPYKDKNNIGIDDGVVKNFVRRPDRSPYKLCCNIAIWRRKDYIGYIRNHETPWQFEILGSRRAARYKKGFYSIKPEAEPVYCYDVIGPGICDGKWNLPTRDYFEKYGIEVDYSKRGFNGENPYDTARINNYSIREAFPGDIFKSVFWRNVRERISNRIALIKSLI